MTETTTPDSERSHGPRYVIGIDLGTTNSAVAYVDLHEDADATRRPIRLL